MAHFGEKFYQLGSGGDTMLTVSIKINRQDVVPIQRYKFEALSSVSNEQSGWFDIQWRWFWIHLYRDGQVVRQEGGTGWMSGGNDSYSTNWITCAGNNAAFRAVCRFQARAQRSGSNQWWYTNRFRAVSDTDRLSC